MQHYSRPLFLALILTATSAPAMAWDPNEGANWAPPASSVRPLRTVAQPIAPQRSWQPAPAIAAQPPVYSAAPVYTPPAYTPPPAPAPVAIAPVTASTPAPSYTPAYAMTPPPPPPVYYDNSPATPYAAAPAVYPATEMQAGNDYILRSPVPSDVWSVGAEGFWDKYEEETIDVKSKSIYGSLTGSYKHFFTPQWFGLAEARTSFGEASYKSGSGKLSSIPENEHEVRLNGGYRFLTSNGYVDGYLGIGNRYYRDELKGEVTSIGKLGYDRRIFQVYMPIGYTYVRPGEEWTFKQSLEFDALLWGNVSSRLRGTGLGLENVQNRQEAFKGWGLRGEVTLGQLDEEGRGFEFGPFFRYWDVDDSKTKADSLGNVWIEPENTRLQLGAVARYNF